MVKYIFILITILFISPGVSLGETRSNVVIKVRAINPLDEKTEVSIRYPLPVGLTLEDIKAKRVKRGNAPAKRMNFKIRLDEEQGVYVVDQPMTLGPKEIVVLEVEAEDVWVISTDKLDGLQKQTEGLLKTPSEDEPPLNPVTLQLKEEILRQIEEISAAEEANTIAKVGVQAHIDAYGKNREMLQQVQTDITMLENMLSAQEAFEGAPPVPQNLKEISAEQEQAPAADVGAPPPSPSTPPAPYNPEGISTGQAPYNPEGISTGQAPYNPEGISTGQAAATEPPAGKETFGDKLKSWFKRK